MCGTPLYMAPQILKHEKYTNKSDIWSLGLIFYEMLYGKTPWSVRSQYELIQKCTTQKVRFPINVKVSEQSKTLIKKCLEVQESKRIDWDELFNYQIFENVRFSDLDLSPADPDKIGERRTTLQ